jgi:recombination protein RecT
MARIALTCFRKNPNLAACDPKSVFAAVITASQMGWEPGINCHLVPYGRECQLIPDWKGLVDLVHRAGRASVWTGAVYEGDEFDYTLGDSPYVNHKPKTEEREETLTYVYAVGRVKGSEWPVVEVWPVDKIVAHRDRYNKVGKRHYSFENLEMYGRKVALLQVLKYMPKSVELAQAVGLEHAASTGSQHLNVEEAIDAAGWVEQPEPETAQEAPKSATEEVKKQIQGAKAMREAGEQQNIWPKRELGE